MNQQNKEALEAFVWLCVNFIHPAERPITADSYVETVRSALTAEPARVDLAEMPHPSDFTTHADFHEVYKDWAIVNYSKIYGVLNQRLDADKFHDDFWDALKEDQFTNLRRSMSLDLGKRLADAIFKRAATYPQLFKGE